MKRIALPALLAATLIAAPAYAAPKIGMVVVNPNSMTVGRVVAINADGTELTVRTKNYDHVIPVASFKEEKNRLIFARTAFEIDAEKKDAETLATALDVGKPVFGADEKQIGSIAAIDEELVTLELGDTRKVAFPRNGVSATAKGAMIGWTFDQFQENVVSQLPPAPVMVEEDMPAEDGADAA